MSSDKRSTLHRVKDIDDKREMLGSYQSTRCQQGAGKDRLCDRTLIMTE
jgi:hypothetical protein